MAKGPIGIDSLAAGKLLLADFLAKKTRGDRITAQDIVAATGFDDWRKFGKVILAWARSSGFVVRAVRNDGYRVLAAVEHIDASESSRRSAQRREVEGFRRAVTTPVDQLGERDVVRHGVVLTRAAQRVELSKRHDREIRDALKLDAPPRVPLALVGR